jgi:protein-L-isoaspartate(D-aspartate) O-methyltransferase
MEARVLQELELKPDETALEIGTGSGYLTALLARSCSEVTSVEIIPRLLAEAQDKLAASGIRNARLEQGDGARGWGEDAYDAIVLTGSTPVLPDSWLKQLRPGGRLFAVVGDPPA